MNSIKWNVSFSNESDKYILKLDKPIRERIRKFARELQYLQNPRLRGEALTANLANLWKYRVGDYRLICRINDRELLILIVKIGHRSNIYKR